jgi:hypothetical protein
VGRKRKVVVVGIINMEMGRRRIVERIKMEEVIKGGDESKGDGYDNKPLSNRNESCIPRYVNDNIYPFNL